MKLNNDHNVLYIELVLDKPYEGKLEKVIAHQHITLCFNPTNEQVETYKGMEEKAFPYSLKKYGNDGRTEGFQVEIPSNIPYFNAAKPHITLALGNGAAAVETGFMTFDKEAEGSGMATLNFFMANVKPEA